MIRVLLFFGLLCHLTSPSLSLPKRRLDEWVSHYEPLSYDMTHIHDQHERLKRDVDDVEQHDGQPLNLKFAAHNKDFHLVLTPGHPSIKPTTQFLDGYGNPFPFDTNDFMTGFLEETGAGIKGSTVHGHIFKGLFRGSIHTTDESYYVEGASDFFPNHETLPFHSVIYRGSDVTFVNGTCGSRDHRHVSQRAVFENSFQNNGHHRYRRAYGWSRERPECQIILSGDHTLAQYLAKRQGISWTDVGNVRAAVGRKLGDFLFEGNHVFERTVFGLNGDLGGGQPEGISVVAKVVQVFLTPEELNNKLPKEHKLPTYSDYKPTLKAWGKRTKYEKGTCASYLVTHQQYTESVLGYASTKSTCEKGSVGLVTTNFKGDRYSFVQAYLVFVHEFGHNFGSKHDEDFGGSCVPGRNTGDGSYIMSDTAVDGSRSNNFIFSQCSLNQIKEYLSYGASCFTPSSNGSICGNGVKEKKEQCDCGLDCDTDPCCTTECKLKAGIMCSPQEGPCCNTTCKYIPVTANHTCSAEHDCRIGQEVCNGTSSVCPIAPFKEDGILCDSGTGTCDRGECNASLCIFFKKEACECSERDLECSVCCKDKDTDGGKCTALSKGSQNTTGIKLTLQPGASCADDKGFCNFLNLCRRSVSDGALKSLQEKFFSEGSFLSVWDWARENWYFAVLIMTAVVGVFVLIAKFGSKKTTRDIEAARAAAASAKYGGQSHSMTQLAPSGRSSGADSVHT